MIPSEQILVVAGLHFPVLRILVFFGMIRILIIRGRGKRRLLSDEMNGLDKAAGPALIVSAVAGVLLLKTGQAFTFELGELYTALGTYFPLHRLIRDGEDVVQGRANLISDLVRFDLYGTDLKRFVLHEA